jgi:Tfp pilus assembly protein PilO
MKLSSKSALILAVAVLVVAALAFAAFLVYPKWQEIGELNDQIAVAQQEIDQAQSVLEQRQAVKADAAQTNAELLRLSNELPESPELPSLIIQLQDTTNEAGVEFISLTPVEPVQNTGYSTVKLNLQIAGAWADVIDFMHRISNLTRQVRIVGYTVTPIALESTAGSSDTHRVNVTIELEVYTLAPTTQAGAAVPPAPTQ